MLTPDAFSTLISFSGGETSFASGKFNVRSYFDSRRR